MDSHMAMLTSTGSLPTLPSTTGQRSTLSTGTLLPNGRNSKQFDSEQSLGLTDMSWMSTSWDAGATASTSLSRSSSLQKASMDSHTMSRSVQQRRFMNNH